MVYFVTIILNNFLIAEVSSVYENFQMTATLTRKKNQIHLIKEYLMYIDFFSRCGISSMESCDLIIMLQKFESNIVGDLWEGTVKSIKKHVSKQVQDLRTKIFTQVATKDQLVSTKQEIDTKIDDTRKELKQEIQVVTNKIEDTNREVSNKIEATRNEVEATQKELQAEG